MAKVTEAMVNRAIREKADAAKAERDRIRAKNERIRAAREAKAIPRAKAVPVPSSPLRKVEPLVSPRKVTAASPAFGADLDDKSLLKTLLKMSGGDREAASSLFTMARPGVAVPRGPGRPPKAVVVEATPEPVKRGPGRPKKVPDAEPSAVKVTPAVKKARKRRTFTPEEREAIVFGLAARGVREGFDGDDYVDQVDAAYLAGVMGNHGLLEFHDLILTAARVMGGEEAIMRADEAERAREFFAASEPKRRKIRAA